MEGQHSVCDFTIYIMNLNQIWTIFFLMGDVHLVYVKMRPSNKVETNKCFDADIPA